MINQDNIKKAILEENLSGWLFFNFRHRDIIADRILGINKSFINSRGWFYIVFPDRENIKITHSVEPEALSHLPGKQLYYTSREELKQHLLAFSGMEFATQKDKNLTQISYLDSGTSDLLAGCGITLASSAALLSRTIGILDRNQIESHESCASLLYAIVRESWEYVCHKTAKGEALTEKMVQSFILDNFRKLKITTEHPPLVAFGSHTADPHYETGTIETFLEKNSLVQFDIWGKTEENIYADISWVGFSGKTLPPGYEKAFNAVVMARDNVVSFIRAKLASGTTVTGYEADDCARYFFAEMGLSSGIRHRTGHSIDSELHGCGTNLDSIEFPDHRPLYNGACFSIEPGLYFRDFGVRSEINSYILDNTLVVSGGIPQSTILMIHK